MSIFFNYIQYKLPKLAERLQMEELTPHTFAIEWFLTFFAKTLNPDITSRIWDIYLFEGISALFKAGVSKE